MIFLRITEFDTNKPIWYEKKNEFDTNQRKIRYALSQILIQYILLTIVQLEAVLTVVALFQMAKSTSLGVGCGHAYCGNEDYGFWFFLVCNYASLGTVTV